MRYRWGILLMLCASIWISAPAGASTGDIGSIIEGFVSRLFPDASSRFWVVNNILREDDEWVLDVNAVIVEPRQSKPVENRYLLLIVAGEVIAAQHIPLDPSAECQTEQT
ncbi:MAG: hypothetical protein ACT4OO_04850 [Nitrospiraceae bacterium]